MLLGGRPSSIPHEMPRESQFKRLLGFVSLAECRSFSKAAQRMGITQPSLSYNISKLEEQLSIRLFERSGSGVILTPQGRTALVHARSVLDAMDALESVSMQSGTGMLGEIKLGASPTLGPYILPQVVQKLRRQFPNLKVYFEDAPPRILLDGLLSGRHDVIFAQLPLHSDKIIVERLFREPLKLALPSNHPLARKTALHDKDLAGEHVLSLSSAFTLHAQLSSLCDEVGAILRADYEGTSLDALRHMTAMEMGVTLLPALYVHSEITAERTDVVARTFRGNRFTRSIGLARRTTSGNHVILNELSQIIRDVVRNEFSNVVKLEGR